MRIPLIAAAALVAAAATAASPPPEPDGFRGEPYRAPVPATLQGAIVIGTPDAEQLWKEGDAVFVDALPRTKRPEGLPEGTIWHEPPHVSIKGSLWLPNTGYEALSSEETGYLSAGLAAATDGWADRPLVFFCKRDCWMSWNVAKRAVALGYASVHWFPDGVDGWQEQGLPTETVEPFQ